MLYFYPILLWNLFRDPCLKKTYGLMGEKKCFFLKKSNRSTRDYRYLQQILHGISKENSNRILHWDHLLGDFLSKIFHFKILKGYLKLLFYYLIMSCVLRLKKFFILIIIICYHLNKKIRVTQLNSGGGVGKIIFT